MAINHIKRTIRTFRYERFRWLFDISEQAVQTARSANLPDTALAHLTVQSPDGTELFSWDKDRIAWLSAIINLAEPDEIIPFIERCGFLQQIIEAHPEELEPRFIRHIEGGIAMHPAIYFAAGNAEIDWNGDFECFDFESFKSFLTKWVQQGY